MIEGGARPFAQAGRGQAPRVGVVTIAEAATGSQTPRWEAARGAGGLPQRAASMVQNGPGRAKRRPSFGAFWTLGPFVRGAAAKVRLARFMILPSKDS